MSKMFTMLIALLLSGFLVNAQGGGGYAYSQLGEVTPERYNYASDMQNFSFYGQFKSADDISVPAEGLTIYGAVAYFNQTDIPEFGFSVYTDFNNRPYEMIENVPVTVFQSTEIDYQHYEVSFEFSEPIELEAGKYWISIYAKTMYNGASWLCLSNNDDIGNKAMIIQPAGMWIDFPTWTVPNLDYMNNGYYNLAFALMGAPVDNDLLVKKIISPKSGELTNDESVSIEIQNGGLLTQNSFKVMYQISTTIDGDLTEVESSIEDITAANLEVKDVMEYTFLKKADLSAVNIYSIKAAVVFDADQNKGNDATYTEVKNYGDLFIMGTDKVVTTCNGIFVDDGSVTGDYSLASFDTITFYPGVEGNRISIDFTMLDVNYWDVVTWTFYDGNSTDAPILYQYKREEQNWWTGPITARNSDGAITVVLEYGQLNFGLGWEATISCIEPELINFTALEFNIGEGINDIYYKNKPVQVSAIITNSGANTVSRKVHFIENNEVIQTQNTKQLVPGQLDTINFVWTPSYVSNEVSLNLLIENDPQETNQDNMLSAVVSVNPGNIYIESFEQGPFFPIDWRSLTGNSQVDYNTYSTYHGEHTLSMSSVDTIVMPPVMPGFGNKLSFVLFSYYDCQVEVLYSKHKNGPWQVLGVADYLTAVWPEPNKYTTFEYNISEFNDTAYYFALAMNSSYAFIDFVKTAPLYYYNVDMKSMNLEANAYAKQNLEVLFHANVRNHGNNKLTADDYQVVLRSSDSIYATTKGIDIESQTNGVINIPCSFATIDTLELYYELIVLNEIHVDNNQSNTIQVIVTDKTVNGYEPISTSTQVIGLNYTNYISEMIYYPSEIGAYGNLNGIELTYNFDEVQGIDNVPVRFYLAQTTSNELITREEGVIYYYYPEWIETDSLNFTKVYDGMLNIQPGTGNSLYIPFAEPFVYDGNSNLVLMIIKDSMDVGYQYLYVDLMFSETFRFANGSNLNTIDTDNIITEDNWGNTAYVSKYGVPAIKWHFDAPVPVIVSQPVTSIIENSVYNDTIRVQYNGMLELTLEALQLPSWMTFTVLNDTTAVLTGIANQVGTSTVQLMVTDGKLSSTKTFNVQVLAIPTFVSTPVETLISGDNYLYEVEVTYNGTGASQITFNGELPTWLSFTDHGNNTATLVGTTDVMGTYPISIMATGDSFAVQNFDLHVGVYPVIESLDDESIKANEAYTRSVAVTYLGADVLSIIAGANFPDWLTLTDNGNGQAVLSGTPTELGLFQVDIIATDGAFEASESLVLNVCAVPVITSLPVETILKNEVYTYNITVSYAGEQPVSINADVPSWLTFTDNGDGTAVITGTASVQGYYAVTVLAVGECFYTTQTYTIFVDPVSVNSLKANQFVVYPNPASSSINVESMKLATLKIHDITGKVLLVQELTSLTERVNVSMLNRGVYMISITNAEGTSSQRLVIE